MLSARCREPRSSQFSPRLQVRVISTSNIYLFHAGKKSKFWWVYFWLCSACHFYGNHVTRNDLMAFWWEKRRKSVQQTSMLENEVKRDGGGKIRTDSKEDRMTSSKKAHFHW